MKHFTKKGLDELEKSARVNLINSISGYKPANLIGTISKNGRTNLAIFSSVVHLGSSPPLFGFITRPPTEVARHTYENIRETGVYTINHIHESFVARAHYTSAKFDRATSEFAACGLTEEFTENFAAPFVAESKIKIGLKFVEEIPIKLNGTILIVGEVEHLLLSENALLANGGANLNAVADVCISGLDAYHAVREIAVLPAAEPDAVPDFKSERKQDETN